MQRPRRARSHALAPEHISEIETIVVRALRAGAQGCELAFHAAAHLGDWGARAEFERANVEGTRNALEACAAAGVRRFVHVSTEAVLLAGRPLVEVDETALKIKETCSLLADGFSAADLRHGPIAAVTRGLPVVALCAAGPARADIESLVEELRARLIEHKLYIARCGDDMPEIRDWKWKG